MSVMNRLRIFATLLIAVSILTWVPRMALAHGSVTPDADLCVIQIGYFKAHFKVYLPETHHHEDFCEDLPGIGNSVFVMEYEHDGLAQTPIDFRIIENITGQGRFTNLGHIEKIENLDKITVFHHPAAIQADVFTVGHNFDRPGEFVGIVSVTRPDGDGLYTAVFPFEAGYTGFGYWPWIIAGLLLLQLNFLWMSGRLDALRNASMTTSVIVLLCTASTFAQGADEPDISISREGHFQVSYTSEVQPPVINRIHNWVLYIVDANGEPVSGASISVRGGMPVHDHGLPTAPRVTSEPEPGTYLLEGVRFHMRGQWEIEITIDAGGNRDVVIIPLNL